MIKDILDNIYPLNSFNIVLADGKFPKDSYLQSLLSAATVVIACDGATKRLIHHNIIPDYIIGDCDSINPSIYNKFRQIITKIDDQNCNDLTKAINLATAIGLENIVILGATGLREDHAIANIALLIEYSKQIKHIAIISDYGIFTVNNGTNNIKTVPGQQISLFSLINNTVINCQELKWPLLNCKFKLWNNGTLNEAIGDKITIVSNKPIIIYRAFCIKG